MQVLTGRREPGCAACGTSVSNKDTWDSALEKLGGVCSIGHGHASALWLVHFHFIFSSGLRLVHHPAGLQSLTHGTAKLQNKPRELGDRR